MIKLSHSGFFQSSGRRFTAIPGTSLSHSKAKYIIGEMGETGPELETKPMSNERRHNPYEPQEFTPAKPETGPHLSRWKKLALLAETAVLLPTLAACARGDKGGDVQVTPAGVAPITRTAEITPTATTPSGETIVPGTNMAVPTETPRPTETVKPTETPNPAEVAISPIYGQLRSGINGENIQSDEKTSLLSTVDKLEKTAVLLGRFERTYLDNREADGTPTLYALQTERIKNVDFTSLYPGKTKQQALQQYWKDNLQPFFVRDIENLHGMEAYMGGISNADDLNNYLKNTVEKGFIGIFSLDYTQYKFEKTEPRSVTISVDSDVKGDTGAEKAKLEALAAKIPNIGELKFRIASSLGKHGENGGDYDYTNNVIELTLRVQAPSEYLEEHEAGHGVDIGINSEMVKSLSPEAVVKATILREKIVNSFYENLTVDNLLSKDSANLNKKINAGQALGSAELPLAMQLNAQRRFLVDVGAPFSEESGGGDAFFGGRQTYSGWAEVIAKQGAEMDRLAKQNKNMSDLVADIRNRPAYYDQYFGDNPGSVQGFGFSNEIHDLGLVSYLRSVLDGKISPDNKVLGKFKDTLHKANLEVVADETGTLLKWGDSNSQETLPGQYLQALR